MLEAHAIGNLVDRHIATLQAHLHLINNSLMNVLLRRHRAMLAHKVAKVVSTHIELLGTPCHRGQLVGGACRGVEVVEQQVDMSENIAMTQSILGIYPIVKPQTLREKHHNTSGHNTLRVLIEWVLKLEVQRLHTAYQESSLHLIDTYLLLGLIDKEYVVRHTIGKQRTLHKTGMKAEHPAPNTHRPMGLKDKLRAWGQEVHVRSVVAVEIIEDTDDTVDIEKHFARPWIVIMRHIDHGEIIADWFLAIKGIDISNSLDPYNITIYPHLYVFV